MTLRARIKLSLALALAAATSPAVAAKLDGAAQAAAAKPTAPAAPPAPLPTLTPHPDGGCITLDDFSQNADGAFPAGWRAREEKQQGKIESEKTYVVAHETQGAALRATYGSQAFTIVRKIPEWDLSKYPVLAWSWKATVLPTGADESKLKSNDSAASVYLVWKEPWPLKGSFIRFAWSSTLPAGQWIERRMGFEKIQILESGAAHLNEWREERVNVAELAEKRMKKKGQSPVALALLTDADSTGSHAAASYARFRLCRP